MQTRLVYSFKGRRQLMEILLKPQCSRPPDTGGLLEKKPPPPFNTSDYMQPRHLVLQNTLSAPRERDSRCKLSPCSVQRYDYK